MFKVDSWRHEIELSIMSNSDQISEDKNETQIIKEDIIQITQQLEEMSSSFLEEKKVLKTIIDENSEKNETQIIKEDIVQITEKLGEMSSAFIEERKVLKTVIDENKYMKAKIEELLSLMPIINETNNRFDSFLQEDYDAITDVKNQVNENNKVISLIKSDQQKHHDKIGRMINHLKGNSESITRIKSNQQKDNDNIGKMINHLKRNSESISRIDSNVKTNARRINSLSRTSHHHGPPN